MKEFYSENKIFINVFVIFIVIMGIIYLFFNFSSNIKNKAISYDRLLNMLYDSSVKYCSSECDNVISDNSFVTIPAAALVEEGYMSEYESRLPEGVTCDANVKIYSGYNGYRYLPMLDCGEDYKSVSIYDKILSDYDVVDSGAGLYSFNNLYLYRGEYLNNYVKIGDHLFRIVDIDNEKKNIKLVLDDYSYTINSLWDDRYNADVLKNLGVNDFAISRAYEKLVGFLNNDFSDISKKVIKNDYCIGVLDGESSGFDKKECVNTMNSYISLLSVSDFLNASLDANCISLSSSTSCQNYNYLANYKSSFWFVNPSPENSSSVYRYNGKTVESLIAKSSAALRFVVTISGDELYDSGDGSEENPYIIKEAKKENSISKRKIKKKRLI